MALLCLLVDRWVAGTWAQSLAVGFSGLGCLLTALWCSGFALLHRRSRRQGTADEALHRIRQWLCGSLLAFNLVAFLFVVPTVVRARGLYRLRVVNDSGSPVDRVVVFGPQLRVELGPIGNAKTVDRPLTLRGSGPLDVSVIRLDGGSRTRLEEHVRPGMESEVTLTLLPRGGIQVQRR